MKLLKLLLVLSFVGLGAGVSVTALADDDTATAVPADTKAETGVKNAKSREDIDSEITNAKLRAQTGAKSLYSFQSQFIYNGSSLEHPLAKDRPILSGDTVENDPAKLVGAISGKYRLTDHDNLNLGVGVGWLTPTYSGQRGQVEDPYFAYGRVFKALGLQNVLNVAITYYTADSSVQRKDLWETDIDHTILWSVPHLTKLQLGLNALWLHEIYGAGAAGNEDELALFPFLEYEFTSTFSFRTVYRGLSYYNTLANLATFTHAASTQSLGIGISVTRDFYLYPNVQWVWDDERISKTNVALNANINL